MLSQLCDSFDYLFSFLDDHIRTAYLLNSLEELLEFTAAILFLCALVLNLFEIEEGHFLGLSLAGARPYEPGALTRKVFGAFTVLMLLVFSGIRMVYGVGEETLLLEGDYRAFIFADASDGLKGPDGLVYSPAHGLILGQEGAANILVIDRNGKMRVFADAATGLVSPEGLAVRRNTLFVSDDSQGKVLRYDAPGNAPVVVAESPLKSPEGLAVDPRGGLSVADEKRSMVVNLAGSHPQILASSLNGLKTPEEITFDDQGNLYVTDEMARAVFKISPSGESSILLDGSEGLESPEGIVFHQGMIYVTDNENGTIFRLDPDGYWEKLLKFSRGYRALSGIAFDSRDDLYVVSGDPHSNRSYLIRVELNE